MDVVTVESEGRVERSSLPNPLGLFWVALTGIWTVAFVWRLLQMRSLIADIRATVGDSGVGSPPGVRTGGWGSELSNAVWTGEFAGQTYSLPPDHFVLILGGLLTYGSGLVIGLVQFWVHRRSGGSGWPPWVRSMAVIVVVQILIFLVFRFEIDAAGMHTDT